ncbi:rsbT co-antagonist protein RsbR [Psychrobacillus sp. OK028]|uniref:STAS domain-containing protein n=1 Tax=Psychrobacillus sp. OK028 TaxID=1884359 RepID=UPI000891AE6C|nr:STAS domain-containing protein [Psychrobacillus sp. OK028]SDO01689.1 rsbT co-antagonist protein RsbR [Psychrobacillus sp. OK028]
MDNKKLFFNFLLERTWLLTERWYENLNKNLQGVYSTNNPKEIKILKEQNHLFHQKFVNLFNDSDEEYLKSFDNFIQLVIDDSAHQQTPLPVIIGEFFRQQYLYKELLEEFIELYPNQLTGKQIITYYNDIISTINDVVLRFSSRYIDQAEARLLAHQELIGELSVPIIELVNKTAVLPIVGEIDTKRAKIMLEQSLSQCVAKNIDHLYIDLSGVPVVDTMVAQQLFQMIETLKLIGVSSSLSGVRPSIAQTSVQLGLDFEGVDTHSTISQAMRKHNNF